MTHARFCPSCVKQATKERQQVLQKLHAEKARLEAKMADGLQARTKLLTQREERIEHRKKMGELSRELATVENGTTRLAGEVRDLRLDTRRIKTRIDKLQAAEQPPDPAIEVAAAAKVAAGVDKRLTSRRRDLVSQLLHLYDMWHNVGLEENEPPASTDMPANATQRQSPDERSFDSPISPFAGLGGLGDAATAAEQRAATHAAILGSGRVDSRPGSGSAIASTPELGVRTGGGSEDSQATPLVSATAGGSSPAATPIAQPGDTGKGASSYLSSLSDYLPFARPVDTQAPMSTGAANRASGKSRFMASVSGGLASVGDGLASVGGGLAAGLSDKLPAGFSEKLSLPSQLLPAQMLASQVSELAQEIGLAGRLGGSDPEVPAPPSPAVRHARDMGHAVLLLPLAAKYLAVRGLPYNTVFQGSSSVVWHPVEHAALRLSPEEGGPSETRKARALLEANFTYVLDLIPDPVWGAEHRKAEAVRAAALWKQAAPDAAVAGGTSDGDGGTTAAASGSVNGGASCGSGGGSGGYQGGGSCEGSGGSQGGGSCEDGCHRPTGAGGEGNDGGIGASGRLNEEDLVKRLRPILTAASLVWELHAEDCRAWYYREDATGSRTVVSSQNSTDEWAVVDVPDVPLPSQSEEIDHWEASIHPTPPSSAARRSRNR